MITAAKLTLCLWIGVPAIIFFLNFIENIGISLINRADRINAETGMKSLVLAQAYRMLEGSFVA